MFIIKLKPHLLRLARDINGRSSSKTAFFLKISTQLIQYIFYKPASQQQSSGEEAAAGAEKPYDYQNVMISTSKLVNHA